MEVNPQQQQSTDEKSNPSEVQKSLKFQKKSKNIQPEPTSVELNPPTVTTNSLVVPFPPQSASDRRTEKKDSNMLKLYNNVQYLGMSRKCSQNKIKMALKSRELDRYMSQSRFFSKTGRDDHESKNRAGVVKNALKNPEFIMNKDLEAEAEAKIHNPNSIAKPYMIDSGTATFDYTPPDADQVGIVKSSNEAYAERRDRYFIPPEAVPDKTGDLLAFFENMQQQAAADANSGPKPKKFAR